MIASITTLSRPVTAEESLFDLDCLHIGTRLIFRGQRSYDGVIFEVVGIGHTPRVGGRRKKMTRVTSHDDELTLLSAGKRLTRRTVAGYIQQSAHWRIIS